MSMLVAGLLLFLGAHSVSIINEPWRNRVADRWAETTWKFLFAAVSLVGLALIIHGYGAARHEPVVLYVSPQWLRHVALVLLVPVFPLLIAAYLPGRIRKTVGHPMLLAVKLWAAAHLLANGNLADLLLFGGFLAWAVAERVSLERRTPRAVPGLPASNMNDLVAIVVGLVVYGLFAAWLHPLLIGVPVI